MINAIVFSFFFLLLMLAYGWVFCSVTEKRNQVEIWKVCTYGFMTMLSVYEVAFIPCMLLKTTYNALFYLFSIISALIVFTAIYFMISGEKQIYLCKKPDIRSVVLIITVIAIAIYVAWVHFENYDDGYYVAISNIALEENSITLNTNVAYTGDYYFADSCPRPTINSWELLVAFFCKLASLHPAIAFHTILPLLMIPIFVLAAINVFQRVCKTRAETQFALLVYICLFLFFDKSMQMISPYCTIGTSNGKAILWYFVFPLVTECGIELYKEEDGFSLWSRFTMLTLTAVCATATGIYTIPLFYAMIGIPYIFFHILSKDRMIVKKIRKMFVCLIPVIIIGLYSVLSISGSKDSWAEMFSFNFGELLNNTYKDSWVAILLAIICLILMIVFRKKDNTWKFFLSNTVILIIIVFNPLTAPYIAEYITGTPVYDRLFLLFLTILVIPIGGVFLFRFFKSRIMKCLVTLTLIVVIVLQGIGFNTFTYYNNQLPHQNAYQIRNDVMEVIRKFDEIEPEKEINLLSDYSVNRFFRQYSSRYHIIVARYDTVPPNEIGQLYLETYKDVFSNKSISTRAQEGIERFDVDYLVLTEPIDTAERFNLIYTTENNSLFLYKRAYNI